MRLTETPSVLKKQSLVQDHSQAVLVQEALVLVDPGRLAVQEDLVGIRPFLVQEALVLVDPWPPG